jgi:hypothetical protein
MGLYDLIKQRDDVFEVANDLFVAAFHSLFLRWKQENCTVMHFNEQLDKVKELCRFHPQELLDSYAKNAENLLKNVSKQDMDTSTGGF